MPSHGTVLLVGLARTRNSNKHGKFVPPARRVIAAAIRRNCRVCRRRARAQHRLSPRRTTRPFSRLVARARSRFYPACVFRIIPDRASALPKRRGTIRSRTRRVMSAKTSARSSLRQTAVGIIRPILEPIGTNNLMRERAQAFKQVAPRASSSLLRLHPPVLAR